MTTHSSVKLHLGSPQTKERSLNKRIQPADSKRETPGIFG